MLRRVLLGAALASTAGCAPREPVPESALGAPTALASWGGDGFYFVGPVKIDDLIVSVTAQATKQGVVKVNGTTSAERARAVGFGLVDRRICGPVGKGARVKPGKAGKFRSNGQWVATYVCA